VISRVSRTACFVGETPSVVVVVPFTVRLLCTSTRVLPGGSISAKGTASLLFCATCLGLMVYGKSRHSQRGLAQIRALPLDGDHLTQPVAPHRPP